MSVKEIYLDLTEALGVLYDKREAENISSYILEDIFLCKNPLISQKYFTNNEIEIYRNVKARLLTSEPWQYIVGKADFYGEKFFVNPSVLIPRPETEELVYLIVQKYKKSGPLKILDVGTGSGCIAVMLAKLLPQAEVHAVDVCQNALDTAIKNADALNIKLRFLQTNILNENKWSFFDFYDIIVSNPPYISPSELEILDKNVRNFEPSLALFTYDEDPLQFYRAIAKFSKNHLNPGGALFFELSKFHAKETFEMIKLSGFNEVSLHRDLENNERMISAYL